MEELYKVVYNKDYYCVTANALAKGLQGMSLREAQLLYIAISQVVKADKDFKTYTTTVPELAAFMGIDTDSLYRDLKDLCVSLKQRNVVVNTGKNKRGKDNWKVFGWIQNAEYNDGTLTIRLSDDIKPFLLDLDAFYVQSKLGVLLSFGSYYSIRLYQYLRACYGEQRRKILDVSFTVDELRTLFQTKKKYSSAKDLLKYTIKSAVDELNRSDYAYISNYTEHHGTGRGKPLESVSFSVMFFESAKEKANFLQHLTSIEESKKNVDAFAELAEVRESISNNEQLLCTEEEFETWFPDL